MGIARDNIEAALIATGPAEKIAPQVMEIFTISLPVAGPNMSDLCLC